MAGFKIFLFNSIHLTQTIRCTLVVTMPPKLMGMLDLRTGIMIYAVCTLLINGFAGWPCFFHMIYILYGTLCPPMTHHLL